MTKSVVALIAAGVVVAACGGPGASPDIIVPTSGDSLERVEYTDAQVQVYKDALIYETLSLNTVEGMTWDTDIPDEQWGPYVVRAKAFCDDARTNGWSSARDAYTQQVMDETLNAMPDEALELGDFEEMANEMLAPVVDAQLRAIGADGSLCPELAPSGFEGTVMDPDSEPTPQGEPLLDGRYFGEGCEGAGNALLDLLGLLQGIEDGSTDVSTFEEDIIDIAAGLRYSALSESDASAAREMNAGVGVLSELLVAFESRDAEEFGDKVMVVSEQAINIIDVCGLG